jgi:hypothetical protein
MPDSRYSTAMLSIPRASWGLLEQARYNDRETSLKEKFLTVDALIAQAWARGALPLKNPLEGIETALRIARIINNVRPGSG